MTDSNDTTTAPATTTAPRDTRAVAAILGGIGLLVVIGVLVAVFVSQASTDGEDALDGVRGNRIQAVTLTTDVVYFGHLKQRKGDWLELEDAYFLRSTPDAKDATKTTTTVVSVKDQAGGDGNLVLNSREVLSVQNLTADSQITQAIEDAEG